MRDQKLPPGTNRCRCAACGEYFGGVGTFDKHRVGHPAERSCLGRVQMRERGLRINEKGYWVTPFVLRGAKADSQR